MPAKPIDLIGQTFARWTVLAYLGRSYWLCKCSCGTEKRVFSGNLVNGKTLSCGCLRDEVLTATRTTHGKTGTPEYKVWAGMKRRCQNKNEQAYARYGARGVTVCERWSNSFECFLEDMGERPSDQHSIDRIDNNKGYEPGNCRWIANPEQARNKTNNHLVTYQGITRTLAEWAQITGIGRATIEWRINSGWTTERTLTTPAVQGRNQTFKR